MKPPETIRTARLILRRLDRADAEAIFSAYARDPAVTRFLPWRPHRRIGETRAFIRKKIEAWKEGTEFTWTISRLGGGLVGGIALRREGGKVDFGYVLARKYWGQGIAAEALRALVDWALAQPEVFRAWAVCDFENRASARVLEKAGLTREGILRAWTLHPRAGSGPRDCLCYSIVKRRPRPAAARALPPPVGRGKTSRSRKTRPPAGEGGHA